ncbi:MAG: hypothetical protein EZS28_053314, partial [Streblomastix strix]
DDLYQGFNFATDIDEFIEKQQIDMHVFTYGDNDQSPCQYAIHHYKCDTSERDFKIHLLNKPFHQSQESNVIILCDEADEVKFNVIKDKALQQHDESTSTLTFSVNNNIDPKEKLTKPYYRNLANLNQIDTFLDQIYRHEQRSAFKIRADFGTIIEMFEYDGNEQKISYKYILPVDANTERWIPLIIKSQKIQKVISIICMMLLQACKRKHKKTPIKKQQQYSQQ